MDRGITTLSPQYQIAVIGRTLLLTTPLRSFMRMSLPQEVHEVLYVRNMLVTFRISWASNSPVVRSDRFDHFSYNHPVPV